mmetsp:Transcript_42415/g.66149  ORF Transcript_42415/g.66149 Transcript_42415/m.66149 type:complete len:108 (-) Transcript_42415:21-344(-)
MAVLRNLFHHGFHCLCHLFVTRSSPESSLLCPLLLDPMHPVITDRHKLMAEQPVALLSMKRAAENMEDVVEDNPAVKRPKASGSDFAKAFGDEPDGCVSLHGEGEAS